jgi:hypothetical protein
VLLLRESPRHDKSTIVDSFPGDVCPLPVITSTILYALCLHHLSTTWSPPTGCAMCSHEPSTLGTSRLLQLKRNSLNSRTPEYAIPREDSDPTVLSCFWIQWFGSPSLFLATRNFAQTKKFGLASKLMDPEFVI